MLTALEPAIGEPEGLATARGLRKLAIGVALAFFASGLVATSWLSDDAYITIRTVDNFFHGYGLRWNIAERVQVFTHPLWALLLVVARALTGEFFYATHFLCIAASLGLAALLARQLAGQAVKIVWLLALLTLSKSFLSYSTSGLENPLTHLLLGAFFFTCWFAAEGPRRTFLLSLWAALLLLNRQDTALLVGPLLAWELWRARSRQTVALAALAFAPLVAWELFSLFYYGSLVPNTANAKLNLGIPAAALGAQARIYYKALGAWDPLAPTLILVGIGAALWRGSARARAVALGIALQLAYVYRIGGDFMLGRFVAAPFLLAALLLAVRWPRLPRWLLPLPLLGLYSSEVTPWRWVAGLPPGHYAVGVADERIPYFRFTGLVAKRPQNPRQIYLQNFGIRLREQGTKVVVENCLGQVGYFAGPTVHILDDYALAEPLLSRLPVANPTRWRVGHFPRAVPPGYQETLETGRNQIRDPALAAYYDKLALITRRKLLDPERLKTIVMFQLGAYDHWIEEHLRRL